MKFISSRIAAPTLSFREVVMQGLAQDGGLYVPEFLPNFSENDLAKMRKMNYQDLFFEITHHFVNREIDDEAYKALIAKSYQNFSHAAIAPIKQLSCNHFLLELFHGPTLAFKDFALQFLGNLFDYFLAKNSQEIAIIGATSGDTGSAAIEGCKNSKATKIFILHPHNKVSPIQRRQMTCVDSPNVFNIALEGNFDDCQNFVKQMFANQDFLKGKKMTAVNSINFARILAQIVYYFYAALRLGANDKTAISFSVPSGNFGDIYAGFLAKKMGLNINKLIIATNSNDILARFVNNNDYRKEKMIETISPSMNIQVSSNFERLLFDYHRLAKKENLMPKLMKDFEETGILKVDEDIFKNIQTDFFAVSCDDEKTKKIIKETYQECAEILDPHTATGIFASQEFMKHQDYKNELIVTLATAHPAKFPDAVIQACAQKPQLPNFLSDLENKEEKFTILENNLEVVKNFISKNL
jgi:threonine synthase